MLYKDFENIANGIFGSVDAFVKYTKLNEGDIKEWKNKDEVPHFVTLILQSIKLDKAEQNKSLALDKLVEECLPLATFIEEATTISDKLEEMFLLQKELNDSTNGKNWELGTNKFNKEINWLRCIYMEVSELIESTPWKHWKNINSSADIDNIRIELVDIWHFLMSYILQETNIPKAVSLVNAHCVYEASNSIDISLVVKEAEKLSYIALAIQTKNMPTFSGIERFIEQFFRCCKVSGLSFTWLQKLYIGKNCLNKFRQDNGYKEGTYRKIWDNKEDNVAMVSLLEELKDVNFENLYKKLDEKYKSL